MIRITGDTHGEQARFLYSEEEKTWKKGDHIIVCGDFGFIFHDNYSEKMFLNDLEKRPYTICFVDGNHENFEALNRYPVEEWNGGKVHRIRNNIFHLMRGQVFTIENQTFFTFGGGFSLDRWRRQLGVSYWEEEMPSDADYKEADKNLKACDYKVDFVLTHTAPKEVLMRMGYTSKMEEEGELNGFLEYLLYKVNFRHWYCGHFHRDTDFDARFSFLYYAVKEIGDGT